LEKGVDFQGVGKMARRLSLKKDTGQSAGQVQIGVKRYNFRQPTEEILRNGLAVAEEGAYGVDASPSVFLFE
jgi:hypothetical protein